MFRRWLKPGFGRELPHLGGLERSVALFLLRCVWVVLNGFPFTQHMKELARTIESRGVWRFWRV